MPRWIAVLKLRHPRITASAQGSASDCRRAQRSRTRSMRLSPDSLPSCCSLEGRLRLEAFERQLAHTGRHTSTSSARILATSLSSEAPHGQATVPWLRYAAENSSSEFKGANDPAKRPPSNTTWSRHPSSKTSSSSRCPSTLKCAILIFNVQVRVWLAGRSGRCIRSGSAPPRPGSSGPGAGHTARLSGPTRGWPSAARSRASRHCAGTR